MRVRKCLETGADLNQIADAGWMLRNPLGALGCSHSTPHH